MLAQHGVGRAQALAAPHEGRQAAGTSNMLTDAVHLVYVRELHARPKNSPHQLPLNDLSVGTQK